MEVGTVLVALSVGFFLAFYLAMSRHERRQKAAPRTYRSGATSSAMDEATRAAITTVVVCSSIDIGHH